jgi:hypothetical protein
MPAKRHLAIRIAQDDLDIIDEYAANHGLDRTGYLIKAGLQELDERDLHKRLDDHEQRLERIEHYYELST